MAPGHADETNQHKADQVLVQAQDKLDALVQTLTTPVASLITTPFISFANATKQEFECLAKNIFYEAANEPEEGKVAVGVVTLNRATHDRFPKTICGVVNQRTTFEKPKVVTKEVKTFMNTRVEKVTVSEKISICQFSWTCMLVNKPKPNDERWEESRRIARALLDGEYEEYRAKYQDAMYFHAIFVKPSWAKQKEKVNRIGGHIFYADK